MATRKTTTVKKRTSHSVVPTTQLKLFFEGDDEFEPDVGRRGRQDVVSPVLDEVLQQLMSGDLDRVQFKPDVYTINQVRAWAAKRNKELDGVRVRVSGGGDKNIQLMLVPTSEAG